MSRYHSYLNSATAILKLYDGGEPFSSFLKKHFAANKKFGSKDRKQISHLCYCFFRLGKMAMNTAVEERIIAGLFLCSDQPNELLQNLNTEWNEKVSMSVEEKIKVLGADHSLHDIFPWKNNISDEIEFENFCKSFFTQPDLFIRVRPGRIDDVLLKIDKGNIPYKAIGKDCIAFSNTTKIDDIIEIDKEAVIQDYNSQKTFELIKPELSNFTTPLSVWDCCAASGGKSIMAYDVLKEIRLTVSDVRESIMVNLRNRFERAGIAKYRNFIADLSKPFKRNNHGPFDLVIADVPCSGSGTWGRTPEQLFFFAESAIDQYAALQQKIISNIIPFIKPGGYLLYITCSVFKKENEEAARFILDNFNLELIEQKMLTGYDKKSDTLFTALLKRRL